MIWNEMFILILLKNIVLRVIVVNVFFLLLGFVLICFVRGDNCRLFCVDDIWIVGIIRVGYLVGIGNKIC